MSGPNSAPNGDRSLVSSERTHCVKHAEKIENCNKFCEQIRKRDYLAKRNNLHTGKTR